MLRSVIVLPVAAIFVATVINHELPSTFPSAIAITGSVIAGVATVKSLFREHLRRAYLRENHT